ncbi:glutaredoxin domain-containing cysteine-rich protein 2 [Megalops cyprinoides]|uniref:glutaredoxin domain-containing cysteine-rich protein 2 n=1 Tax=Megalops cyprinoides TaxID=118141 RepID=UPI001863AB25|nr:glutaredoxin domain-containing cysteine-rich protein 2 [Megalops cyprinoides]
MTNPPVRRDRQRAAGAHLTEPQPAAGEPSVRTDPGVTRVRLLPDSRPTPAAMTERQRKPSPHRHEGKPRKVRFKIASSYSGRVLKHVYEDGQELESPGEKYPHSFIHGKMPHHLEMDQLCGFEGLEESGLYPTTGLIAQRINVYRGMTNYRPPAYEELSDADSKSPVLDFGKIIIYTSNLRIIRSPQRKGELTKSVPLGREGGGDYSHGQDGEGKPRRRALCGAGEEQPQHPAYEGAPSCPQCGGSGCAPCSLCHGSKLSMLANRFNESIPDLRCQACYPDGLQRCQSCAQ